MRSRHLARDPIKAVVSDNSNIRLADIALSGNGALLADIALSGDGHSTVTAAASGDRRDTRTLRRRVRRAFCKDGTVFVSTGYGCCANQISRTPEDPFTARAKAAGQGNWCFRDTRDAR